MAKFTKTQIKKALIEAGGVQYLAAEYLSKTTGRDCSRHLIFARLKADPELRGLSDALQADMGALALDNVAGAILGGDVETSRWLLQRTHPDFKAQAVRLDDDTLRGIVAAISGDKDALQRMANGG